MKRKRPQRRAARRPSRAPHADKTWLHVSAQHVAEHFRLVRPG